LTLQEGFLDDSIHPNFLQGMFAVDDIFLRRKYARVKTNEHTLETQESLDHRNQ